MSTCETCKANKVCDHNKYGFENCNNHIPEDVEEVKHGEWIKKNGIYVCSECDFTCPYDVVGDNIEYWECLYCRHCGAKMDSTPKERGEDK